MREADCAAEPGSRATDGVAEERAKGVGTDGTGDMVVQWQTDWGTKVEGRVVFIALAC